jgi:hypothetical protein
MDTLIKCVRARGHRYEVDNDRNYIALRDIKLTVKFRERTIKVKVSDKPYREYEWHPNGKLIFRMEGRLVSEWGDLKTRLLEEQLPNILAKLELTAKNEEQYIENARLWRERWEMQRKLEAEREAHHKQELIDFKALLAKAERWKRANVLREYLSAIGSPDVTWLTWAQSKIDWFDPILDDDTLLFVDPFLIYIDNQGIFQGAYQKVMDFFAVAFEDAARIPYNIQSPVFKMLMNRLVFPEPKEACLGYSIGSVDGAGSGKGFAKLIWS